MTLFHSNAYLRQTHHLEVTEVQRARDRGQYFYIP